MVCIIFNVWLDIQFYKYESIIKINLIYFIHNKYIMCNQIKNIAITSIIGFIIPFILFTIIHDKSRNVEQKQLNKMYLSFFLIGPMFYYLFKIPIINKLLK